jgi:cytochrome d ubiquinol oxidase subunit I
MEGHWAAHGEGEGVPLLLFGLPDADTETTRHAVGIPHLGSLVLTHSWSGEVKGLSAFPPADRPNAAVLFWTFRAMVGLGLLMIVLGGTGAWLLHRRRAHCTASYLRFAVAMGPAGLVAVLAGWMTTEIGRQPWVVYGVMRTADALGPAPARELATTLAALVLLYTVIFGAGTTLLVRALGRGAPARPGRHGSAAPLRPALPALSSASFH